MGWHFLDLTDDQKQERRERLDKYASIAQLSALVPLLVVQCYFLLTLISSRRLDHLSPSSPRYRAGHSGARNRALSVAQRWKRFTWWCAEAVVVRETHLGLKGEVLLASVWLAWLLLLCTLQTGEDYLHLTKRFGIVAASQLPLHYLLAMKSEWSPMQILTRRSHETLNGVHQLLGRVMMVLLYLHASFYLNFYVQKDLISSKVKEAYVICGIVAITSLTILGITALPPLRHWNYRVFYTTHVVVAAIILPVLFFHVSHIRIYLYESLLIYVLNVLLRKMKSRRVIGTIKRLGNTNLIEIHIPDSGFSGKADLHHWHPGQHAYLSVAHPSPAQTLRSNPFSVASLPSSDGHLRFVARVLNGNTNFMALEAKDGKLQRPLHIEGPYGLSSHSERLLHYDRVLFVAGGSGGTFITPLYRQLLADLSPGKGTYRRQKVTFTWIARSIDDVAWALPEDDLEREGLVERLSIYLTGRPTVRSASDSISAVRQGAYNDVAEGIELEETKTLLSEGSSVTGNGMTIRNGRPNVKQLVDDLFLQTAADRVAVLACGPRTLGRDLRRELRKWIAHGRDVWYWEEVFAL